MKRLIGESIAVTVLTGMLLTLAQPARAQVVFPPGQFAIASVIQVSQCASSVNGPPVTTPTCDALNRTQHWSYDRDTLQLRNRQTGSCAAILGDIIVLRICRTTGVPAEQQWVETADEHIESATGYCWEDSEADNRVLATACSLLNLRQNWVLVPVV